MGEQLAEFVMDGWDKHPVLTFCVIVGFAVIVGLIGQWVCDG